MYELLTQNDEIITYMNSVVIAITAEVCDYFNSLKPERTYLTSHEGPQPIHHRIPFRRRILNAKYQTDYYDWIVHSMSISYLMLNRLETDRLFKTFQRLIGGFLSYKKGQSDEDGAIELPSVDPNTLHLNDMRQMIGGDTASHSLIENDEELGENDESEGYSELAAELERQRGLYSRVFKALNWIQSAGLALPDIFLHFDSRRQYLVFQSLVLNLFIWGATPEQPDGSSSVKGNFRRAAVASTKEGSAFFLLLQT